MGKVRKRNVGKDSQKTSNDENTPKAEETTPQSKSNTLLIILIVMIVITWGVAATAYFGLVDFKGILNVSKRDVHADLSPPEVTTEPPKAEDEVGSTKAKVSEDSTQPKQDKQEQSADNEREKQKPKENKKKPKTLSDEDKKILTEIKKGEKMLDQKKGEQAWKYFKDLTRKNPDCPKAKYLEGKAAELTASQQRSNPVVSLAIDAFTKASEMSNCPKELKKLSMMAKSENQGFLGRMVPALETMRQLAKLYPTDLNILNKLGVRYLMVGKNKIAKKVYEEALKIAPNDGFALVHMGFIVKNEGDWEGAIPYLAKGTESNEPGTQEGKFYFHLGDALHRTNRTAEAEEVYEKGAEKGLFRSKYQRSLYNVDRLRGQPFWTPEEAGVKDYVRRLQLNWQTIRDEALSVMDTKKGLFKLEEESLKDTGEWRQFTLFARGNRDEANCRRVPKTCAIIEQMPNAKGCRRGQVKFSVMMPGTHVWPHTGPTNCRLRMHLGLVIPQTGSGARLACAGEMRTWTEGKVMIFDDSFEHEVWQEAESFRLILIVDIWHPDLTDNEKKTITSI